jgi:predicted dehydrogenase
LTPGAVKWGLIGTGDIARKRVAPALRDSPACDLVAVSRARAELAQEFAAAFGARRWYAGSAELLADNEIDAVYIATPVHLHAEQTIAAAEAGKHILCEKPMALDGRECDRMIDACRAHGVALGVAYYRHMYPAVARLKSLLASGEIGEPVLAQINAFERFNPAPGEPRHWFVRKAQAGGGPMFDFGCHRIEILLNVFGPITEVSSLLANVVFEREVEDTAAALFRFERGACATLTVTHAAIEPQDTVDVYGTRGSVRIRQLNAGDMTIRSEAGERFESHPPDANLHRPLIDDFADAVLTGREPKVTGSIGRAVAVIEEQIYRDRVRR